MWRQRRLGGSDKVDNGAATTKLAVATPAHHQQHGHGHAHTYKESGEELLRALPHDAIEFKLNARFDEAEATLARYQTNTPMQTKYERGKLNEQMNE